MPNDEADAGPDPVRNLQVIVGGAGLLAYGWSWAGFSGPFRQLVDLQLRVFGSYSEPAACVALALPMIAAIWLAAVLLERARPNLSERVANAVVATAIIAASVVALWQAGHLWRAAAQMPRLSDPMHLVDLDTIGNASPALGHVRVIGTPERARQVLTHSIGRHGMGSYWEAWVPVTARQQNAANAAAPIIATYRDSDRATAANAVPNDPEGMLLVDGLDTRTMYEAQQEGLDLDGHSFVLFPDETVRFDMFTNSVLLCLSVVLFWGLAAYSRVTGWRAGNAPVVGSSARPRAIEPQPVVMVAIVPASLPPERVQRSDGRLTRFGTGGVVAAILSGWVLWDVFGLFPTPVGLWAYAATALTFVASLLLTWLGRRFEPEMPVVTRPQGWVAPASALVPPPGGALLCVLRDEPGFSSPSYKRVNVDGARVAVLKANRYTVVALRPGSHMLAVNTRVSLTSDIVARFDVAPGDVVVYQLQIPLFGTMRLERMPNIAAVRETLARLKPVAPSSA